MGETDDEDDFDMAEVIEEYDEGDILSSVHAYLAVDKTWSLKERAALTLKNQSTFGYIAWALSGYSARLYVESEEYNSRMRQWASEEFEVFIPLPDEEIEYAVTTPF